MTIPIHDGSSLIQARNSHHHHQHRHLHSHNHARFHNPAESKEEESIVARSPNANLEVRQADTTVEVVQTVSVVQIVDGQGGTLGVSTLSNSPPETQTLTPTTNVAVAASTYSVSPSEATASDGLPPSTSTAPAASGISRILTTLSTVSASSIASSLASSSLSSTSSSAPTTTTSGFASLTGVHNTTTSGHSQSLFTNSTTSAFLLNTTSSIVGSSFWSSLPSNSSSFDSSSTSFSWSSTSSLDFSAFSTSASSATATETGDGGSSDGAGGAGGATATATTSGLATSSTAASTASHGLSPATQGAVIGGVVGGLAGLALIIFAAMFLLKWKRRNMNGIRLGMDGEGPAASRALPSAGGGPGEGGGSSGMADRSAPFSIPSTLAALSGMKRNSQPPSIVAPEASERGFYRVSGRKLTSVLQSGGDGYSDPHQSVGGSSFYRDSEFLGGGDGTTGTIPLQLGSPMRPESGVPVIRSGPQRTPVEEYGPFSPFTDEPPDRDTLTPPRRDGLGQSLVSRDGSRESRGSSSRFTENIL